MSLLREIQEAIIDPKSELGPILLRLRLLADRLGSDQLEEWVKYESEGYPKDAEVPDYRSVPVSYTGTFTNVAWSAKNQPIPSALIEKFAGKQWTNIQMRDSIAAIDAMLRQSDEGQVIGIDASNLILLLQGKVMEDFACNSVTGKFSVPAIREIQNTVRTRILELTMKLEKEVPGAAEVTIGKPLKAEAGTAEKVAQVVNMTVHGPNTMITSTGTHAQITINNTHGDIASMVGELVKAGIPEKAAREFADIVQSEEPESIEKPFGTRAAQWLGKNIVKAADGTWKIGAAVATNVLQEAALRYYGLK